MNKQLIYCVDDEESIRVLLQEALKMGGYDCQTFPDASSFWGALQSKRPDLILLDIMLPGTDGVSLLKSLMSGAYRDIPVIMVSAKGNETDKVLSLNEGASDYLTKPFGVMELLARIKANLRKAKKEDVIRFKELAYEKEKHYISLNGEQMSLSIKEFDLLAYFLENQGKIVGKEELLASVWGIDVAIETRTVDMFISRLRKKIASSSAEIETVRGVGYILK